ncbi:nucleotidyltransferase substrate binding protein [Synechococcus sp. PCC 6312]|uniref:nucleotidyltransferase substrate binding protein n=1 Tax=Synechococcus sp. (strain ATCC 27167 / PCC 6312) TaxID=195253 RepID=UPI00029F48C1|nr:nucleotidyltransferase substrate binding protein [Synechococcus sp. PCC 6312]AFY60256.1 nucleotidyltransferase substrate binding protein, HI0074 family [Synechococcus sp. PCC 6312]
MIDPIPRWAYRFDNYHRALILLEEAINLDRPLSQLEKEGLIQRFEYTMELAWKTLKDYLESEGLVLEPITPRTIIRSAFEARIIHQGDTWQQALDARNRMAHTYNLATFERVLTEIRDHYFTAFKELDEFLAPRRLEIDPP